MGTLQVFLSLTLAATFAALLSSSARVVCLSESETAILSDGSDSSCDPAAALVGVDLDAGSPGHLLLLPPVLFWISCELSCQATPAVLFSARAYASRAPPSAGLIQLF